MTAPTKVKSVKHEEEIKTQPLEVRQMPDQIATSLQHIVRQMDILTQTMSILEVVLIFFFIICIIIKKTRPHVFHRAA